jgi:1,4-dihydroxy-2-naphthoyl-CoA hydrolase
MPSTDPNRGAVQLSGFDGLYGLSIDEASPDEMRAHVVVQDHHKQPAGLVHGGVFAAMGEAMASIGTWLAVGPEKGASGMTNTSTFVRPITDGTVYAVGRPRHRGRTTWVWEIDITDDQDRLCALVRVTIAVIQPR